jgi:hypothetical protein
MTIERPRIRDIPSFSEVLQQAEQFDSLRKVLPLLSPFLKLLRIDVGQLRAALQDLPRLRAEAEAFASVPDRFNELFAPRGWIMHGDMSLAAAQQAIEVAETEDLDRAEEGLVKAYAADEIEWMLRRMHSVRAFRPRMRLAELALTDYREARYHACIPVVLAQLDGTVSQLHEERRGFFADGVELTAWDSIAAHESGLGVLARIFGKGRRTLNTDPLSVPYRHGILHGMDVAYDNEVVAAKTWAALFSIRDWAVKAEQGMLQEPPPKAEPTFRELLQRVRSNDAARERISAWIPREVDVGVDVPKGGKPDEYERGTPERQVVEFLTYWSARNYGYMAKYLDLPFGGAPPVPPHRVREAFADLSLRQFELVSIEDKAPAVSEVQVRLVYSANGVTQERIKDFRLVYWSVDSIVMPGDEGGQWSIVNWYV